MDLTTINLQLQDVADRIAGMAWLGTAVAGNPLYDALEANRLTLLKAARKLLPNWNV